MYIETSTQREEVVSASQRYRDSGSLITDQTVVGLSLTLCSLEVISKGRGLVGGVVVWMMNQASVSQSVRQTVSHCLIHEGGIRTTFHSLYFIKNAKHCTDCLCMIKSIFSSHTPAHNERTSAVMRCENYRGTTANRGSIKHHSHRP